MPLRSQTHGFLKNVFKFTAEPEACFLNTKARSLKDTKGKTLWLCVLVASWWSY